MSVSSKTLSSAAKPLLSSSAYDKLKHTVAIVLPAVAALYIGLGQVWHFPRIEQVSGSIATINTFLGVLLGLATKSYNNSDAKYAGVIQVDDTGVKKNISLVVNGDPEEVLSSSSEVTFKVSGTGETPVVNERE